MHRTAAGVLGAAPSIRGRAAVPAASAAPGAAALHGASTPRPRLVHATGRNRAILLRPSAGSDSRFELVMSPREQVASNTRHLADWAAATDFHALPGEVASRAARVVAENLAAIVAARDEPEVAAFHRILVERGGLAEATLFRGGRVKADRVSAAVGNALAADWLELEEGYRKASCHAGLFILPALLAEAEASRLPMKEVLRAVAVAYEVV